MEGGFPTVNVASSASPPVVDLDAIHAWHCPIGDVSLREYQRSIVYTGLLNNTLVCLPTGLGKTRIAAVIMYNFYRWFPSGKIIFMAPTKPLVNQQVRSFVAALPLDLPSLTPPSQIEACHAVGGFDQRDMISMTGTMQATKRAEEWKTRRIVFCTPQTAENDMDTGICNPESIVLLIIDEAHKATGNYAYVNVVRKVAASHPYFRVIALSATPGSSNDAIQTIVSNLLVSKIEVRTDESDDVRSHMHEREIEKIEVPLGEAVQAVRDAFSRVLSVPTKFLQESGALFRRSIAGLTKGAIFTARTNWRNSFYNQPVRDEGKKMMIESNYGTQHLSKTYFPCTNFPLP
jgi:fanconi anemia group M protein